jgi:hypothetical protein
MYKEVYECSASHHTHVQAICNMLMFILNSQLAFVSIYILLVYLAVQFMIGLKLVTLRDLPNSVVNL